MVNHPNRNWRSRWSVDLENCTATHRDGWVFKFSISEDDETALDGKCVSQPSALTSEQIKSASRIAREAGEIYIEAREGRH